MTAEALRNAASRLRRWATDQALPLWATAGFDREHGRFHERLTMQGTPILDVPVRLLVQGRQVYSYGLAARRGWHADARKLTEQAFASMVRDFHRRDGRDGWVFSVRRDGAVADARRDFYAIAFVLLAAGSYLLATGDRSALRVADDTLAYLDSGLRAPRGGGYLEGDPAGEGPRRQNPHMHLFEGLLTLWSSSQDRKYLDRAEAMFDLFASRFYLSGPGVLGEYFDDQLEPDAGAAGRIVEPGHHYEWVWLLRWFERESGRPVGTYVERLYGHANTHGYDKDGLIVDEVLIDGTHQLPSHRTWPVTEAIKANIVEAAAGRAGAADRVVALANILLERFLTKEPPGGWIDRLDQRGQWATDFMPASTLYHVMCAIDELDRFAATV
ncbi:MAG TPA: AGE family epimerase/isomerase [Rhizomicrobium sp.]|nr:AGE family epimerase/isomerase [Rhizomicrobium sp.]